MEEGNGDSELEAIFFGDEAEEASLPRKKVPCGDIYEAARAGDVGRLRFWLEEGVDVNARDAWDSVPLYYACLAGHLDAGQVLLESGAICSEHTFDGDRCHYAALNLRVRKLLKVFEARPPPLHPLARALREAFSAAGANSSYGDASALSLLATAGAAFELVPDMIFSVDSRAVCVHRAILAARSPFFRKKFGREWKGRREIRFSSRKLSFSALFSLVHFFYSDRLDVAVEDMEDLVRICRVCGCRGLQAVLEKEMVHQKYADYKSLDGADESQRRYILQGSALPEQERLPAALRDLFRLLLANSSSRSRQGSDDLRCGKRNGVVEKSLECSGQQGKQFRQNFDLPLDEEGNVMHEELSSPSLRRERRVEAFSDSVCADSGCLSGFDEDHADVCFLVEGNKFRSHTFILAARSEYFKTRFSRATEFQNGCGGLLKGKTGVLPVLEEHDISATTFERLMEYVYTGTVEYVDPDQAEELFDAASRYLMFSLKRAVAEALLPQLENTAPAELCNWLLLADMYGVWKLRNYCLDAMALNLDVFAATREFRAMLASLPPPSGDSSLRTSAPGEGGKAVQNNILDDLREKWLAIEGEELDKRDASAAKFDNILEQLVIQAGKDSCTSTTSICQ